MLCREGDQHGIHVILGLAQVLGICFPHVALQDNATGHIGLAWWHGGARRWCPPVAWWCPPAVPAGGMVALFPLLTVWCSNKTESV